MAESDPVDALGSEAAQDYRALFCAALRRLVETKGLGRVQPVGEPSQLPPPPIDGAVPDAEPVEVTVTSVAVARIPEDREVTRRELAEQKRRDFPDHVDLGPPRDSLAERRF